MGAANRQAIITIKKTSGLSKGLLPRTLDYILWYSKTESFKYKQLFLSKVDKAALDSHYSTDPSGNVFRLSDLTGPFNNVGSCLFEFRFNGKDYKHSPGRQWKTTKPGVMRLSQSDRVVASTGILVKGGGKVSRRGGGKGTHLRLLGGVSPWFGGGWSGALRRP